MITFGYNNRFSSILRSGAAISLGLVMIISTDATETVVKVIAALLFLAGIFSLLFGLSHRQDSYFRLLMANAMVDVAIGLLLFIFPTQIAHFIPYLLGIALLIFGVLQMLVLSGTVSLLGGPFLGLILSGLAIVGGLILLFNPFSLRLMGIIAGIALVSHGVSELMSVRRVEKAKEAYENQPFTPSDLQDAKEVEYMKIDEQ